MVVVVVVVVVKVTVVVVVGEVGEKVATAEVDSVVAWDCKTTVVAGSAAVSSVEEIPTSAEPVDTTVVSSPSPRQ